MVGRQAVASRERSETGTDPAQSRPLQRVTDLGTRRSGSCPLAQCVLKGSRRGSEWLPGGRCAPDGKCLALGCDSLTSAAGEQWVRPRAVDNTRAGPWATAEAAQCAVISATHFPFWPVSTVTRPAADSLSSKSPVAVRPRPKELPPDQPTGQFATRRLRQTDQASDARRVGLDVDALATRPGRRSTSVLCRPCLDWSERRPHLAGAVRAAICTHSLAKGWIRRIDSTRAVAITPKGRQVFQNTFGARLG